MATLKASVKWKCDVLQVGLAVRRNSDVLLLTTDTKTKCVNTAVDL